MNSPVAAYLGLVHDIGKADCAWQERLAAVEAVGGRVGIDHKMAGTWLASRSVGVFAAAVNGHHGGLPGGAALKNDLRAADTGRQAGWAAAIEKAAASYRRSRRQRRLIFPPGSTARTPGIRW